MHTLTILEKQQQYW